MSIVVLSYLMKLFSTYRPQKHSIKTDFTLAKDYKVQGRSLKTATGDMSDKFNQKRRIKNILKVVFCRWRN